MPSIATALKGTVTLSLLCLLASAATQATPVTYSGTNATGDFWDRPILSGLGISGNGPVQYHVQAFFTDLAGTYDFVSNQTYDGYLHLYLGAFDPTDQLSGLVIGNDDFPGIGVSGFDDVALAAATQYYLVTSAFQAGQTGTFDNTISDDNGQATITLGLIGRIDIPEPGTLALLGLGLLAMRRRRFFPAR